MDNPFIGGVLRGGQRSAFQLPKHDMQSAIWFVIDRADDFAFVVLVDHRRHAFFFSNFKANTFLQSSVVDNQHELRIVSDFIRSEVQKAGYRNEESPNQDPFSQNVPGFFEASRYLSGSSNTLHIRYQSDGSIRDCVGNPVNKNDIAIVTLSFNKPANASTGMVECISGADRITLLDQVSEFNFHYLKQGAGSYESKDDGNVVVAVKYDIKFERRVVNSEGSLKRKYSQVAALRNVF